MPKKKCMVCPVKDGAVHLATVGHSKLQQFVHVCCAIQLKAESYKVQSEKNVPFFFLPLFSFFSFFLSL